MDASAKPRVAFDVTRLKLSEVSVFIDRADVQRKILFGMEKTGPIQVLIENMSQALDVNTVRIECTDVAKIGEVIIRKRSGFEDPIRKAKVEEMQKTMKELLAREAQVTGEFNRAKEERTMFEGAMQHQANQQRFDNVPKFLTYAMEPLKKMDEAIALLKERQTKVHKDLKAVKSELEQLASGSPRWSALIELDVLRPGEVNMTLTYAVFSVSWSAGYSILVDSTKRTMQVLYRGLVRQKTGEEWSQVEMRLISARYGVEHGQVPILGNWKVTVVEDRKSLGSTASSKMSTTSPVSTAPDTSTIESGRQTMLEDLSVDVEVDCEDGTMNCTFQSYCELIPPDGDEHQVLMVKHTLPVELHYECVPRRAQFAILKAGAINMTGYPLLPGRLSAYLDNSLVASSSFQRVINLREKFECSLGADPAVRVEYTETAATFNPPVTGFFAKSVSSTKFEQRTIIKNRRRVPIAVKVIDMVPNSADDRVKVTLTEPNLELIYKQTSAMAYNKDEGYLIWDLIVSGEKEASVVAKYVVQYPTGKTIKLTEKA